MKSFAAVQSVARRAGTSAVGRRAQVSASRWRSFASATPTKDTLPLSGVRVLDMTRVLAGVSWFSTVICSYVEGHVVIWSVSG